MFDLQKTVNELNTEIENLETEVNKLATERVNLQVKLTEIDEKMKLMNSKLESYRMAKMAFDDIPSDVETTEEVKKTEVVAEVKKTDGRGGKRSAKKVLQFDKYNNMMGCFRSQSEAARVLHFDQSAIYRIMKLNSEQQLRNRGYYLQFG